MTYDLPKSLNVCGTEYEIRSDYRAALDVFAALNDPELDEHEKALLTLYIIYTNAEKIPAAHKQEAIKAALCFLNGGSEEGKNKKKEPVLVSWEQDFRFIVAPVNRVIGQEIRAMPYLHWWTFLSAYYEIGDCTFAQIVRIRDQKARGKKMDKSDAEWYRKNRDIVDIKTKYTEAERSTLSSWGV